MAPDGMYRFLRLVFGVNCAPEVFQRQMERILYGIDNVIIYLDDILIFADTIAELSQITSQVLSNLRQNNLSLNKDKCEYERESLTFLGHTVSKEGLDIDKEKIKDIKAFRSLRSITELKSFLGLVNYVRDYVPNFSDLTRQLREAESNGQFEWNNTREKAFEEVKEAIANCTVTQGFFSLTERTELYTDASPYAIGAVLVQIDDCDKQRIISFASKSLTETEKRYPQTQREALAIVWGVEHFYFYLLGTKFNIKTDAEGIKFIFDKEKAQKPNSIIQS